MLIIMIPNPAEAYRAGRRVVSAWWNYDPILVVQKTAEGRRAKCFGCGEYDPLTGQCRACSCFVLIKSLAATEDCPKGYWGPIEVKPLGWFRRSLQRIASALRKKP